MKAIAFEGVWEKYKIKFIHDNRVSWEEFWALEDINFEVNKGDILGVIGQNGAGKTTLLKLIAGKLIPDKGKIYVSGRVSVLMELGAGFNPEFTGRENIVFNANTYGIKSDILAKRIEEVIDFSELGRFIDAPVKYYSQGMFMRLAFALAIFVEPDILLIDDILSVGDQESQEKCIKKIFELKEKGTTIVLTSHDMGMMSKLCSRMVLLNNGKIVKQGEVRSVMSYYLETVGNKKGIAALEVNGIRAVFNNGKFFFSYNGRKVTSDNGSYLSFFSSRLGREVLSFNLSWRIIENKNSFIRTEGFLPGENALLSLEFGFQDNQLQFNAQVQEADVKFIRFNFKFISQYKNCHMLNREKEFPSFMHKSNWEDLGQIKPEGGFLGIIPETATSGIPEILFEAKDISQFNMLNTGYQDEARVIQFTCEGKELKPINLIFYPEPGSLHNIFIDLRKQVALAKKQEELGRTLLNNNMRLIIDQDNKAVRLYYKDKEITKGKGLDVSFLVGKTWYDSSSAKWEITKENDMLNLHLLWGYFDFEIICKFYLQKEALSWQVSCRLGKSSVPQELKMIAYSNQDYGRFFCGCQEGDLPEEFDKWQDVLLDNPKAKLMGLRKTAMLPALVMENSSNLTCFVQNSDLELSSRTIQMGLGEGTAVDNNTFINTKLKILDEESLINDYINECSGQVALAKKQEELGRTLLNNNMRLIIDQDNKAVRLYYKDKEITKGKGLDVSFLVGKTWYDSSSAKWGCEKVSDNEITVKLIYPGLLNQYLRFTLSSDSNLIFTIDNEHKDQLYFAGQHVALKLTSEYESWQTAYESGNFEVKQYLNNIGPIRMKDNKVSQIKLMSRKGRLPNLLFKTISDHANRILGVFKDKESGEEFINIKSSIISGSIKSPKDSGRYEYFSGNIILGDMEIESENPLLKENLSLKSGKMVLVFDQGRGRLSFDGKELTTGLGIYTSVRFSGIWHDSYQAAWNLVRKDKDRIIVSGKWPYIPILQEWEFKLGAEDEIFWKVAMEIQKDVFLEMQQANIMLSSGYKFWDAGESNKGKFSETYTEDYDILPFRHWNGEASYGISALGPNLPNVFFVDHYPDKRLGAIIENTDSLYKARLLQYYKINTRVMLPGQVNYFSGIIRVNPVKNKKS